MMYEETRKGLLIKMPVEIDHHSAEEIRKEVDKRIEVKNISNLIFDFEQTEFMDSSGIGLLLGRYKMVSYLGGSLLVIHVSDTIYRMMELAGIHRVVNIKKSEKK